MSMQNKVWFITGVSRGFGEALAKTLLSQGNTVIGTTRDAPPAFAQGQKSFHWLKLDVTDTAYAVRDVVNAAFTITGRIDVLVNNAGYGLIGSVEEATEEQVEHLFAVNFHGLRRVTQASLPHLRRQRAGHIINISSMAGLAANPGSAMYSAAKFAVEGLSCGLAKEIAPLGLNLTLIEPGAFRTDFLSTNSIRRSEPLIDDYASTAGVLVGKLDSIAGTQQGDPQKAAEAIIWVANSATPPLHLILGSDALSRTEAMFEAFKSDIAEWRDVTLGTDFSR